MSEFYNGTKLLSMKDITGQPPEIYLCAGNRTAGKTFFFKRMLVRRFKKTGQKFCVLVRFNYEMDGIAESFFKDIKEVAFPSDDMTMVMVGKGLYAELYLNGEHCGYCLSLNSADTIKKYSSRFVDISGMFFDEFQSEVGKYCPSEITKFQSIHVSVARGGGKHVRYVPVYMCSNTVSILNPYYYTFGITKRLQDDTKFLRGNGWVLEQTFNENASEAILDSGFGRAFANSDYMQFAGNNGYLLDTNHMIEKIKEEGRYLYQLHDGANIYGVWLMKKSGLVYICEKYDPKHRVKICFRPADQDGTKILISTSAGLLKWHRANFEAGNVRFDSQSAKNSYIDMLGLSLKIK